MTDLVDEVLNAIAGKEIGFDIETTGLNSKEDTIIGMSFHVDNKEYYIDFKEVVPESKALEELNSRSLDTKTEYEKEYNRLPKVAKWPFLETLKRLKPIGQTPKLLIIHNAKFDVAFMIEAGIPINVPVFDTLIGSILLDAERFSHRLDDLAKEKFGEGKLSSFAQVGTLFGPSMAEYAKVDAKQHYRLYNEWQRDQLEYEGLSKIYWDLEMPVLNDVLEMEAHGADIDLSHLVKFRKKIKKKIKNIEDKIKVEAGDRFLITSPKDLSRLLFDTLHIDKKYTKETKNPGVYKTNEAVLQSISHLHSIPGLILEHRGLIKLLSTYIDPIITTHGKSGKIHASYRQVGAATSRFTCRDPNMQNWPANDPDGIRKALYAPDGYYLIQADYGQIELRIAAVITRDPIMLSSIRDGVDLHSYSAKLWGISRKDAKACNFGFIFGMSARKFAVQNGFTLEKAKKLRELFFNTYTAFTNYYDKVHSDIAKRGYVKTLIGRRLRFMDYKRRPKECYDCNKLEMDKGEVRTHFFSSNVMNCPDCHNKAGRRWCGPGINAPIQGTAADLLKIAFRNYMRTVKKNRKERPGEGWESVQVIALIHDEMLVKAPENLVQEARDLLSETMESAMDIGVPISADSMIVKNWGICKKKDCFKLLEYLRDGRSKKEIGLLMSHMNEKDRVDGIIDKWTKMISKTRQRSAQSVEQS